MQLKTKNTLTIVSTLLIGMLIGFLISGRLTKMRMDNMRESFMQGGGMERHLMRALNPTDEQRNEIAPIFDRYSQVMSEQLFEHQSERDQIYTEFETELKPYLNDRQIERLERIKMEQRRKFHGQKNMKRRGQRQYRGGNN